MGITKLHIQHKIVITKRERFFPPDHQFLKNSSIAVLESNEDDLMEDEIDDDVDELNEDDTTLLLVTELLSEEEDSSDDASAPPSETDSVTLRSDAKADSDFSCFLVIELADSSTMDFSLAEP